MSPTLDEMYPSFCDKNQSIICDPIKRIIIIKHPNQLTLSLSDKNLDQQSFYQYILTQVPKEVDIIFNSISHLFQYLSRKQQSIQVQGTSTLVINVKIMKNIHSFRLHLTPKEYSPQFREQSRLIFLQHEMRYEQKQNKKYIVQMQRIIDELNKECELGKAINHDLKQKLKLQNQNLTDKMQKRQRAQENIKKLNQMIKQREQTLKNCTKEQLK